MHKYRVLPIVEGSSTSATVSMQQVPYAIPTFGKYWVNYATLVDGFSKNIAGEVLDSHMYIDMMGRTSLVCHNTVRRPPPTGPLVSATGASDQSAAADS